MKRKMFLFITAVFVFIFSTIFTDTTENKSVIAQLVSADAVDNGDSGVFSSFNGGDGT